MIVTKVRLVIILTNYCYSIYDWSRVSQKIKPCGFHQSEKCGTPSPPVQAGFMGWCCSSWDISCVHVKKINKSHNREIVSVDFIHVQSFDCSVHALTATTLLLSETFRKKPYPNIKLLSTSCGAGP